MSQCAEGQLALFEERKPLTERLFLGVFPPAPVAERIGETARSLRARHRLNGAPLETERFHVTLLHLGDFEELPSGLVGDALEAAASVSFRPFDVCFDRATSWPGSNVFVLRGDNEGWAALHQSLWLALLKRGRRLDKSFTPHVTMLYDARDVGEHPVQPIGWTVNEFVLVHSRIGKTIHLPLGRWSAASASGS